MTVPDHPRQARLARQTELFPPAPGRPAPTLPEICIGLRQSLNGTAAPWPDDLVKAAYRLLVDTIRSWKPTDPVGKDAEIDEAVLALVRATVRYIHREAAWAAA